MPEQIPALIRLLDEHPLEDTIPRLLRHAGNKIRRHSWMGVYGGPPPAGVQAEDIVQTVLEKALLGRRNWNSDNQPDLLDFLISAVDSEISNLVNSFDNKRMKTESSLLQTMAPGPDGTANMSLEAFSSQALSPEQEALAQEEEQRDLDILVGFHDFLSNDPPLQEIVETMINGIDKPAGIAEHLGVNVTDIYARRKKLKRRFHDYRQACGLITSGERG